MTHVLLHDFLESVKARDPGQPEFLQAVSDVMTSIWPFVAANPRYATDGLLSRIVEAERIIQFRVSWIDDRGQTQVNRGWRVQHNSALGPFKGGMRFHPNVNLSVMKFLAFEQTFKNALTTIPIGGGKGGADFDPKGKSEIEIMRFCQALALELHRHLGPQTDVPAGDIGVGFREVGYMSGMIKKLTNNGSAYFTGKNLSHGGSLIRPEATGYGTVYFVEEMLEHRKHSLEGLRVSVSGSGNVAQYAAEKAIQLGALVITLSDSGGTVYDANGFTSEALAALMDLKNLHRGRLSDFAQQHGLDFLEGRSPWHIPTDVALPCAVQNELNLEDARRLIANGVLCVAEGANKPCTGEAVAAFQGAGTLFAPSKASNAGGVATSGLEMAQNAMLLNWPRDEVDQRLRTIMSGIHALCVRYGHKEDGSLSYVDGANIAGFARVADAMLAQGVC